MIADEKDVAETPDTPWKWGATALFFAVLALVIFGIIDTTLLHPPAPQTAEQLRVRQKQEAAMQESQRQARERWDAQRTRTKALCKAKANCSLYAEARQTCATAGNYETCMSVKFDSYSTARLDCTNDGGLAYAPADLPNDVDCFFSFIP